MSLAIFLKGLFIGISIAAPVGPIGVLCIRRSLTEGRWIGLATGLGAATADALYGAIAAFGLSAISTFMTGQRRWLALLGGLFLCWLGVRTFASSIAQASAPARGTHWFGAWFATLLLTMTNPMTILAFFGIFAAVGLGTSPGIAPAATLVLGVFLGSALWWLVLSMGTAALRSRFNAAGLRVVNRVSGCVVIAFGLYALVLAVRG